MDRDDGLLAASAAAALAAVTALPYLAYLLLYAALRPLGPPAEKEPAEPTVSIVLPTYNESGIVENKLDDIFELDYPPEKIEVVVVDSSDDDTPEIIESYFAEHAVPDGGGAGAGTDGGGAGGDGDGGDDGEGSSGGAGAVRGAGDAPTGTGADPAADAGADPGTGGVFEGTGPTLTLIREDERRGLAPALNDAYAAAAGEVVVKTDCDSYLAEDALREAVATLADPEVAAVTGRNAEVLGGSEVEAGYRGVQSYVQQLESHLDSTLIFHGPFSAFERSAIVPVDPNSLADDTELALRIRRNADRPGHTGGRVVFDPAVRYREAAHSEFGKRRQQKDRRGMGLIRLLAQHRDALGRHGLYGGVVLPFNWWFMIVSPWLLAGTVALATVAGLLLAGPLGLAVPAAVGTFAVLGGREALGPLQPVHAVFDTQVSLLFAGVALLRGEGDGTWEVDEELREAYD